MRARIRVYGCGPQPGRLDSGFSYYRTLYCRTIFEQIKLDFCYQQIGGNLVTVGSAFDYANLGVTHHCYNDFALLTTLPNVEIMHPGSGVEFDSSISAKLSQ